MINQTMINQELGELRRPRWIDGLAVVLLIVLLAIGFWHPPFPNAMASGAGTSGWLSAGTFSAGVMSAGLFSAGVFSTGLFSVGVFSAGVFSLGIFSTGSFALGIWLLTAAVRSKTRP